MTAHARHTARQSRKQALQLTSHSCVDALYGSELRGFATFRTHAAMKAETREAHVKESPTSFLQAVSTVYPPAKVTRDIRSICLLTKRMETAARDDAFPSSLSHDTQKQ